VDWRRDTSLLVCPLLTYKSGDKCYRDPILEAKVVVIQNNEQWILTPEVSTYLTHYARVYSASLFRFSWEFRGIRTSNAYNRNRFESQYFQH